jgi:hypothetical protein
MMQPHELWLYGYDEYCGCRIVVQVILVAVYFYKYFGRMVMRTLVIVVGGILLVAKLRRFAVQNYIGTIDPYIFNAAFNSCFVSRLL